MQVHHRPPGSEGNYYSLRKPCTGDAKPVSDYDLLILVDGEISPDLEETIGNALYHIELEWDQDRFKVLPLHRNIDREGIVL